MSIEIDERLDHLRDPRDQQEMFVRRFLLPTEILLGLALLGWLGHLAVTLSR